MTSVYTLDPLTDDRWNEFVQIAPRASVFHTRDWVEALQRTYGYEPVAYTTSAPNGPLRNGVLFCRVASWLTGRRLVSVPFADHCDPLVDRPEERAEILAALCANARQAGYLELRPLTSGPVDPPGLIGSASFAMHVLDLRPSIDEILAGFHSSGIRRKIARAEREHVSFEEGRSSALLQAFYRLLLLTRRRHGIFPQPVEWFRNLIGGFGDRLKIRLALKDGRPIGSILTLQHGNTLVYKYGCSDARLHNVGAMPFLFWRAIQDAKAAGMETFDLGRSDPDNVGLITFKDRLGAVRSTLTYVRCSARRQRPRRWRASLPKTVVACLPDRVLTAMGSVLYRHMG